MQLRGFLFELAQYFFIKSIVQISLVLIEEQYINHTIPDKKGCLRRQPHSLNSGNVILYQLLINKVIHRTLFQFR
jgi:hypothetical protein